MGRDAIVRRAIAVVVRNAARAKLGKRESA